MLDTGCRILDAGYWILDAGYWMLDTELKKENVFFIRYPETSI